MRLGYDARHHFLVSQSIFKSRIQSLILSLDHKIEDYYLIIKLMLWFCRNNECPACRTHCASRRSLRDDPKYDALIAALYPDIDKYEEEVMSMFPIIVL
jgi:hypothetical protein